MTDTKQLDIHSAFIELKEAIDDGESSEAVGQCCEDLIHALTVCIPTGALREIAATLALIDERVCGMAEWQRPYIRALVVACRTQIALAITKEKSHNPKGK